MACTHPCIPDDEPARFSRDYRGERIALTRKAPVNFCILCGRWMDLEAMGLDPTGKALDRKG